MESIWVKRDGARLSIVTNSKDPDSVEYIEAEAFDDLIEWIIGYKSCKWRVDDNGVYNTECGEAFEFLADGPKENNAQFCIYCGNKIVDVDY